MRRQGFEEKQRSPAISTDVEERFVEPTRGASRGAHSDLQTGRFLQMENRGLRDTGWTWSQLPATSLPRQLRTGHSSDMRTEAAAARADRSARPRGNQGPAASTQATQASVKPTQTSARERSVR